MKTSKILSLAKDAKSIKERKNLSANGFIEATILITPKGNIHNRPFLTFRGLPIYEKEEFKFELEEKIEKTVRTFSLNNKKYHIFHLHKILTCWTTITMENHVSFVNITSLKKLLF